MKINKFKKIFLTILLSLIMVSSTLVMGGTNITSKNNKTSKPVLLKASLYQPVIKPNILFSKNDYFSLKVSDINTNNIVIANETQNESYPTMVAYRSNVLVSYEFSNDTNSNIYIKTSINYGETWSNPTYFDFDFNVISPSFVKTTHGGNFAFGACLVRENSSYVYEIDIPSIGTSNNWNAALWDYSNITNETGAYIGSFYDFKKPDVVSFPDSTISWIIGTISDSKFIGEYENYSCVRSPTFLYKDLDSPSTIRRIIFFPEVKNCSNISVSLGKDSTQHSMVYGVCEIQNGTNQNLLFFHGNPDIWAEEDLLQKQYLNSSEDLKHPRIITKDNDIFIAVETSTNGIVLYHSNNYGAEGSWNIYNVTSEILPLDSNPKSPILSVNDTHLACSFINSGNLSFITSDDNGKNWADPVQINDQNGTVVSEYKSTDFGSIYQLVWTENRNGSKDLYYNINYIPKVDLEITNFTILKDSVFSTFNWISINVANIGDSSSSSIQINIAYTCENEDPIVTDYPGYIQEIGAGETVTVKRPLFRLKNPEFFQAFIAFAGLKNITVNIDPDTVTDDVNSANNILQKEILYKQIFPKIGKFPGIEVFFYKLKHPF